MIYRMRFSGGLIDKQELLFMLKDLESDLVERKASLSDPDRVRQAICAFERCYMDMGRSVQSECNACKLVNFCCGTIREKKARACSAFGLQAEASKPAFYSLVSSFSASSTPSFLLRNFLPPSQL